MPNQIEISEYIDNLPLKKHFGRGYRPDEVYDVICTLSSMYNQILAEAYDEILRLELLLKETVPGMGLMIYKEMLNKKETLQIKEAAMTDKELQKLKRGELLEMLLEQSKENDTLKSRIESLESQLASRIIALEEAGSIAEASIRVNNVFETAQAAAQQYLDNVKMLTERQESICAQKEEEMEIRLAAMKQAVEERCTYLKEETKSACEELDKKTKEACEELERVTKEKCDAKEKETEEYCLELTRKAEKDVEAHWEKLSSRLEEFYKAHEGIRELLAITGGIQKNQ